MLEDFGLWTEPSHATLPLPSPRWDWDALRSKIAQHGVRNSLLLAPMPTASTSQILGNNECFEPYTSNIYVRRVLSGEFTIVNQHLLHDLNRMGLWCPDIKNELVRGGGGRTGAGEGSAEQRSSPFSFQSEDSVCLRGRGVWPLI